MIALTIFASTFILVFALGFQSLNVNNGHYKAAFFTSFGIAVSNLVLFKTLPQADPIQIAAYLSAGPFGIVASMLIHRRLMKKPEPADNVPNFVLCPAEIQSAIRKQAYKKAAEVCSRKIVYPSRTLNGRKFGQIERPMTAEECAEAILALDPEKA